MSSGITEQYFMSLRPDQVDYYTKGFEIWQLTKQPGDMDDRTSDYPNHEGLNLGDIIKAINKGHSYITYQLLRHNHCINGIPYKTFIKYYTRIDNSLMYIRDRKLAQIFKD